MLDFLRVGATIKNRKGEMEIEIAPQFLVFKHEDLMIRGGKFYAVWDYRIGLWSTDEYALVELIDIEVWNYVDDHKEEWPADAKVTVLTAKNANSGVVDRFRKFCQKQLSDNYHQLDDNVIFSNMTIEKHDYASHRLSYPLVDIPTPAWDEIMSTLYEPEERRKIEWSIGAVVNGASKKIQKFLVLYGPGGTGKSTVLDIITLLFEGYVTTIDSEGLGKANNAFALEDFASNPLIAMDHEAKLNRIETNTKINAIVSHDEMPINEKFKNKYRMKFRSFLILATNSPVRITDKKSGILRRLIDVKPSEKLIQVDRYFQLMDCVKAELGGIAWKCKQLFEEDEKYYNTYFPIRMLEETNDFYNFVLDVYDTFQANDETSLKTAWEMYKSYVEDAKVQYPFSKRAFKEELKNYFDIFLDRGTALDGTQTRNYYRIFKPPIDENGKVIPPQAIRKAPAPAPAPQTQENTTSYGWIRLDGSGEIFDRQYADCPAQLANNDGIPSFKWCSCDTTLKDIVTSRLHFVRVPIEHIVIDFDLKENGEKSLKRNLLEASKLPPTYCEISKSGKGVHLHYIYDGDPLQLASNIAENIEIKVFSGLSSLRRQVTISNSMPIASLAVGVLPIAQKKKNTMIKWEFRNEKDLRDKIGRIISKEFHNNTTQSIHFVKQILDEAYESDLVYDFTAPGDIGDAIYEFALNSTNQSKHCLDVYDQLHLKSKDDADNDILAKAMIDDSASDDPLVFFDCEVYKNFFCIVLKPEGEGRQFIKLLNPTALAVQNVLNFKLVGFNCKNYDNHILYARVLGYDNLHLYQLSQSLINGSFGGFKAARDISYTDVYDFCSKRQSLKKWEIDLGIHHQEMGIPWDEPVPENLIDKVVEYCCNDVSATESVFNKNQADWKTRQMLVKLVREIRQIDACVNDSTNSLSAKLIFGNDWEPQKSFNYRFLGDPPEGASWTCDDLMRAIKHNPNGPVQMTGKPWFPGYTFDGKKSIYRGAEIGNGGLVYADEHQVTNPQTGELVFKKNGEPLIQVGGIYYNIKTQDVSGMHPASLIAENLFGDVYTKRLKEIVETRLYIKHDNLDAARKMFGGLLAQFLDNPEEAGAVAKAFKLVVNSVYGKTAQKPKEKQFNRFYDPRNIDNIVAKRGALFMCDLKYALEQMFPSDKIVHIKTDSIKVENTTDEIINFIRVFGSAYGYSFDTEAYYEKLCLVNKSVYIAKLANDPINEELAGKWTATGAQFAVPYVFKTLFSKEPLQYDDFCETISVLQGALYLDFNEGYPSVEDLEKQLKEMNAIANFINSRDSFDPELLKKLARFNKRWEKHYCESDGPTLNDFMDDRLKLCNDIEQLGHNYIFVGRVGQFTPVKNGKNGGFLLCKRDGKFVSPGGTSGFRWMESEIAKEIGLEDIVDRTYFNNLVVDARKSISDRGDFYVFVQ